MNDALAGTLINYDATALAEAIRVGERSATEVVQAHLDCIEKLNRRYNAVVTLNDRALERAREADAARARGESWGPLHGVPVTIKDAFDTAGLRSTAGFRGYIEHVPSTDAWAVDKLQRAGAIVLGKTNCATLCADIQTRNDIFGQTNNPWNVERTSGGSSGGEAAAIALGMSPLGIGSDTGGSIRIPASYCGVFGFKPSLGKIDRRGLRPMHDAAHPWQDTLTVVGPIARSLRDLKLAYGILTDERLEPAAERAPHVAWTHEFGKDVLQDEVHDALAIAYEQLKMAKVHVTTVESPFNFRKLARTALRLNMYEFATKETNAAFYNGFFFFERMRSLFSGGITKNYESLKQAQAAASKQMEEFLAPFDCWAFPATATVAFAHQQGGWPIQLTENGRAKRRNYFAASMGFACPINLLGNPSVVMPIGESRDGLPIALQLVGRQGEDVKLLHAATHVWEACTRGSRAVFSRASNPVAAHA